MAHIKNAANFTKNKKRGGAQAYIVSVLTRVLPMVERSKLRTTCCFGWTRWTLQPASKLLQARSELERHSYFKIWIFWKTGARLLKFLFVDIKLVRSNLRSSLEGPASGAGSGAGYRSRRRRVVSSSKKNQTKRYNITTTVIYTQLLNNGLNKRDWVCDGGPPASTASAVAVGRAERTACAGDLNRGDGHGIRAIFALLLLLISIAVEVRVSTPCGVIVILWVCLSSVQYAWSN